MDTLWGALCRHWHGGSEVIVLSDKNGCQMQVSPAERLQDGWDLADAPPPSSSSSSPIWELPVACTRCWCARAEWEGGVMLLPSTGPLGAGHGEKAKWKEGALALGCTNTLELLGGVGHILPKLLGHSFPSTASAQALPAAEWRQRVIQQHCLVQRATGPGVIAPELGGGGIKVGTAGCMPWIQGCPWRGHNVHGHGGQGPSWLVCSLERCSQILILRYITAAW